MSWGIPLPWDPAHVSYVWFDALTNYLSAVGFGDPEQDYTDWWPVDYHLIGKDIIRHHCVYWPAMLMSAGVEPPKGYAVGGWLLVGGEKMAKSGGNAVNPLELTDLVGVDGFRYYVLAETPYGSDGDFTVEGLVARYNSDLANNLGNLVSRVATVVDIVFQGQARLRARVRTAAGAGPAADCQRRIGDHAERGLARRGDRRHRGRAAESSRPSTSPPTIPGPASRCSPSARTLAEEIGEDCDVVLLGSIASAKYVDVLLQSLRRAAPLSPSSSSAGATSTASCCSVSVQSGPPSFTYAPVKGAVRHGPRPPRLAPIRGIMTAFKKA